MDAVCWRVRGVILVLLATRATTAIGIKMTQPEPHAGHFKIRWGRSMSVGDREREGRREGDGKGGRERGRERGNKINFTNR